MPPKGKDKGGAKGKQGAQLKDILPPNAKQPREGEPLEQLEEPAEDEKKERNYQYLPYPDFPVWPGNQEVQELWEKEKAELEDQIANEPAEDGAVSGNEDNPEIPDDKLFNDEHKFYLPTSFHEFERKKIKWIRPKDYLYEIIYEQESKKMKQEKKLNRRRRTSKRFRIGSSTSIVDATTVVGGKEGSKKRVGPLKGLKVNYKVISYQERPESEEEMKKRKEEEEKAGGKDKKKAPKKGQEEEEQPQMVSVAIETNLDMGFLMPTYSKWLTSQLQFIKDRTVRDTVTKEPIWKRIFPQENGIPIKSPNGKYRVKLRFLGQERLVEIDDKIPCDNKKKLMFPKTTDYTEIWPQLLIKAFFKLYSFKWYPGANYDRETGDSSLVYALTGLIGERIKINDFHKDGMNLLRNHLSDDHYFNNKTYVMTYCGPTFKPKIPSQMPGGQGGVAPSIGSPNTSINTSSLAITSLAQTQKQKLASKLREIASLALSITSGKKLSKDAFTRQRQSYVIPGFGYALMDIFENRNVDMDTIVKKPNDDDVKSPFASPSRAERRLRSTSPNKMVKADSIKKRRSKKKKLGMSIKGKPNSIPPKLKAPPIQYKLLKIKTSVGNYPILNVNPPFTNTEIKLAKKCRLNKWESPPQEYDPNFSPTRSPIKDTKTFKLEISPIKEEAPKGQKQEPEEGKDGEEEEENPKPIVYEPRTRAPGGIWLQASDFPFCFQYFIVFHNSEKIANKKTHRDIWTNPAKPYKANEDNVYIRVRQPTEEEIKAEEENKEGEPQSDEDDPYKNNEDIPKSSNKHILVAFAPNPTLKAAEKLPRYYCRIKQIKPDDEPEEEKKVDNNIVLSSLNEEEPLADKNDQLSILFSHYFSGQMLSLPLKPKYIFKPQLYAPLGYCLWIASSLKIDILTHTQFWIEEKQLHSKTYQVEQGNLYKGKYCYLFKYDFIPTESDTECQFNLKTEDKYLFEYMRMKIVDKSGGHSDPTDEEREITLNEKLVETGSITTLNSCRTEKITFQPNDGKGYSLICECIPPYDIFALNLDLEMISNKEELELERVEMVDPLIYTDTYTPYKYGIIFKEKIYVGQHTSAAMHINLTKKFIKKTLKKQEETEHKPEDGKEAEDSKETEQPEPEYEETEEIAELKKNFKVEILDNNQVIGSYNGTGHITISHFNFRSNTGLEDKPVEQLKEGENEDAAPAEDAGEKEYKHQYVIQAIFDKNDWKEAILKEHEETRDIKWEITVFSSDTVAIVKDTDKEDREKALKESWEQAEPGRAEKSKKSRIRYLANLKKQKGEELTEEEQEILNEKRVRGAANLREAVADPKAAKGKGDKKGGALPEEDEKVEEIPQEFPKLDDYTNLHFRDFIHHFESDRLIHVKCDKAGARLRNEREIEERKNEKENEVKQWEEVFNTRIQNRELEAQDREAKTKQMQDIIMKSREDYINKTQELFGKRNEYRELISNRKYKELLLTDILNAEKIEIPALEQALNEAKEALVKQETLEKAEKKLEVLKYSKEIEEQLQAATGEKNAEKMRELIAQIETENLIIEPKILNDSKNALSKIK